MKEKWFQVSFRLMGDSLPVDEMSTKLGIEPSNISRKGEHIKANPRYAKYQTNVWGLIWTKDSSVSFEDQISDLLDVLEHKQSALAEVLAMPSVRGELFLGFGSVHGQGGAHFPASLLLRIAALGLDIDLDLYPKTIVSQAK